VETEIQQRYKETLKKAAQQIKELEAQVSGLKQHGPIAVIGMGCRFPGGVRTPEQFWKLLEQGIDTVGPIPPDRWNVDTLYHPEPGMTSTMITHHGAFLDTIDTFDAAFFEISPREAEAMDPQQRMLLEVSWEAMENAGLDIPGLKGSRTGIFIGIYSRDYAGGGLLSGDPSRIGAYSLTGIAGSAACGRLAYFYDFQGPCVALDTACSSSLVSLHQAVHSLNTGESDMAIAGGVSLMLSPEQFIGLSQLNVLAPDGRCKAFSETANGFGRGEGCGIVVLKRLKDAIVGNNPIQAIITGTAVNQDGKTNGLTAPNNFAQERLISEALQKAGHTPEEIDYIETHGTGTKLGDPIEIQGLNTVFKNRGKNRKLLIGSVKTNINHLEAAAGIAGVIKVILSMQKEKIPPSLHFETPNSLIPWDSIPITVAAQTTPWKKKATPRAAGVSSFGFTGTNSHIIIQEAPQRENQAAKAFENQQQRAVHILTLSAPREKALAPLVKRYLNYLPQAHASTADICYTSNISRSGFEHRQAVVGQSKDEILEQLKQYQENPETCRPAPGTNNHRYESEETSPIAFMFTGQGSQYTGMGQELFQTEPVFRSAMEKCQRLFRPLLDCSLLEMLYPEVGDENDAIHQTQYTQPLIFMVEYSLARLWESWGITPVAVVGHSIGEYAAAVISGMMTLEDGIRLVAARGKAMQQALGNGAMGVIMADQETVASLISPYTPAVSIAAVNSKENISISGETQAVQQALADAAEKGYSTRELKVSHAFHSILMEPLLDRFREIAGQVSYTPPKKDIVFISTVTGEPLSADHLNGHYWSRQIREPVLFYPAMKALGKNGSHIFIEIGATAALCGLGTQCVQNPNALFIPSMRKSTTPHEQMLSGLAQLYTRGIDINWKAFNAPFALNIVPLPTYPFQGKSYWYPSTASTDLRSHDMSAAAPPDLLPQNLREPKPQPEKTTNYKKKAKADITIEIKEMVHLISRTNIDDIEETADFFTLGMDSLMLAQMRSKIEKEYKIQVSLSDFFTHLNTVEKVARYIKENMPEQTEPPGKETPADPQPGATEIERIMAMQMKTLSDSMSQLMNRQLETLGRMGYPVPKEIPEIQPQGEQITHRTQFPKVNLRAMKFEPDPLTPQQKEFIKNFTTRYNKRTHQSKAYSEKNREVLCDWLNTLNFRLSLKELIYPIVSTRSSGSRIWDIDGNEYIDLAIGFGVHFFGHSPGFIIEALENQLKQGMVLATQANLAAEVAALISELTGVERVVFSNTGTEAVMAALRIARAVTGKRKVVKFAGSFHGTFDGILCEADELGTYPTAAGTPSGMVEDIIVLIYGSQESLEIIKQLGTQGELAAVLVEPVQSRRPGIQPKEFLTALREITLQTKTALIFDETFVGFRIHPGGAQAHFNVRADLVIYGKILGGGMPIGVIAGKSQYLDAIDGGPWKYGDDSCPDRDPTFFAGTFCRHPLALAAARAVLLHLKSQGPALHQRLNRLADTFAQEINRYFSDEAVPIRLKHFGSLMRFESFGQYDLYKLPIEMDLLFLLLLEKGIYTWERRIVCQSTAHTQEDMACILNAVKESIQELRAGGFSFKETLSTPANIEPVIPQKTQTIPMSSIQKSMYALSRMEGGEAAYHHTMTAVVEGSLNTRRMNGVMEQLIKRHDLLRTGFELKDGQYLQNIFPTDRVIPLISHKKGTKDHMDTYIKEALQPFNLAQPPLIRMEIIEFSRNSFLLVLDIHHIIADGESLNIFSRELMDLYQGKTLPPLHLRYKDYVQWEQTYLESKEFKNHEAYWLGLLAGEIPRFDMPTDFPRPPLFDFAGTTYRFGLDQQQTQDMKQLARAQGVTLYMLLAAVFNIFIYKLTGQEDIIIGTPAGLRETGDFSKTIGMFTNTIVLRNRLQSHKPLPLFLEEVKHNSLQAYAAQHYPFERLVQTLGINREPGHNPLFDVQFVYENAAERVFKIENLVFHPYDFEVTHAPLDFTFEVLEQEGHLNINLNYRTRLFKKETIRRWSWFIRLIITSILENPYQPPAEISLLSPEEKQQILIGFNKTQEDYPRDITLDRLFSDRARKTPDKTILLQLLETDEAIQLTDKTIDDQALQLSYNLKEQGVRTETIIGILVDRSAATIIALLGILKAGGLYLPIDPDTPRKRIDYILADSGATLLLTENPSNWKKTGPTGIPILNLQETRPNSSQDYEIQNPNAQATHLAYIIYTSGTTGRPKGVLIQHNNVAARFQDPDFIQPQPLDRLLLTGAMIFDITTFEIWWPLLNGIPLTLAPQELIMDSVHLTRILTRQRITILHLIPQLFNQLARKDDRIFSNLNYFLVGGDRVSPKYVNHIRKKYPQLKILHMYGPTENTTFSTYLKVNKEYNPTLPLGKPVSNSSVIILDRYQQLQPIGIPGELCVSGPGIARGYVNQPELTAEKFCLRQPGALFEKTTPGPRKNFLLESKPLTYRVEALPLHKNFLLAYSIIYRTGDLARWLNNGDIEFLGRIDNQIKIRGFRIEPGEINHALTTHPAIKEAIATTGKDKDNNAYIAAYYVTNTKGREQLKPSELREFLADRLPIYMIPAFFIPIDHFPLTATGKINPHALPKPQNTIPSERYSPPITNLEKKLTKIWQETLEINPIGIHDNFFEKGGHSLNGLLVLSLIQSEIGLEIPYTQIFNHPTISALAAYINSRNKNPDTNEAETITPEPKQEYYELSHSQKRIWVMTQLEGGGLAYNMVGTFEIRGDIQRQILEKVLQTLVNRHESLRTCFIHVQGEVKQRIFAKDRVKAQLIYKDIQTLPHQETILRKALDNEELIPFDFNTPPLLRLHLFHLEKQRYLLLCNMHHIISDGWSIRVFLEESSLIYNALITGSESPLTPLRIQYKDYALHHNRRLHKGQLVHSQHYWMEKFSGQIPRLDLPLDYPRPELQSFNGDTRDFIIPENLTAAIREFSRSKTVTPFMTLYAAINILLNRLCNQTDIVIGTPMAGRTGKDTAGLIGHFLNMLALRLTFNEGDTFTQLVSSSKTEILAAYEHQEYPLDLLMEKINLKRDYSRGAFYDVMVVFNNRTGERNTHQVFDFAGARVEPYQMPTKTSISEMEFQFTEGETTIPFYIRYNCDLFKPETIENIGEQWLNLLENLINHPDTPLKDQQLNLHNGEKYEYIEARKMKMAPISTDF